MTSITKAGEHAVDTFFHVLTGIDTKYHKKKRKDKKDTRVY